MKKNRPPDQESSPGRSPETGGQLPKGHDGLLAWTVLLVSLMLTAIAWYLSNAYIYRRAEDQFKFRTEEIRDAIASRIANYEQVLLGGAALFDASASVTRSEWNRYISRLQLERDYPGFQGVGISQFISPDDRESFVSSIREEGFENFDIRPPGERDKYSAIIYLEPFDWRNQRAFGYDMYSEATRRAAMDTSIETGDPAVSGNVILKQEVEKDVQQGFLIYLPVYQKGASTETVAQRKNAVQYLVYAVFRCDDLMRGILGDSPEGVEFRIYDTATPKPDDLLYDSMSKPSRNANATSSPFQQDRLLSLHGRDWTLRFEFKGEVRNWYDILMSSAVAFGGLVIDLLLFSIIRSIGTQKQKAIGLADEMTVAYRNTIEDLERSNRDLDDFAYIASHDLRSPLRNIDNLAQWIDEDCKEILPEECQQNLALIRGRIDHMEQLLKDLLEYSRVGRITDKLEETDTRLAIGEVVEATPTPDDFRIDVTGEFPTIVTLKVPLQTCVRNLLANAVKHHDRTTGIITVDGSVEGEYLRILVSDDGPGIEPQYATRIFKIFQTLEVNKGSGAGLAIVRKTAERAGGSIELHPHEGRGATFVLLWPMEIH